MVGIVGKFAGGGEDILVPCAAIDNVFTGGRDDQVIARTTQKRVTCLATDQNIAAITAIEVRADIKRAKRNTRPSDKEIKADCPFGEKWRQKRRFTKELPVKRVLGFKKGL